MKTENKPLLLVAEDDPDDQFLIQTAVGKSCPDDIEMQIVENGFELLDYLQRDGRPQGRPGLLIMDLNMPGKDGRLALSEIRADPNLLDLPVVVLTTSSAPEDLRYCQGHGIHGYYQKPNTMTGLEQILSELCAEYFR